jgi:hypothetical protein
MNGHSRIPHTVTPCKMIKAPGLAFLFFGRESLSRAIIIPDSNNLIDTERTWWYHYGL